MDQTHRNTTSEEPIQKEIDKLDRKNKKQEKTVRNLEIKVVQNVNLYFIFQAVILASTTVASPSTTCRSWWIPFTLSLLAAISNLLSFTATMSKVLTSRDEIDQNLADLGFMKLYQMTQDELNQVLPGTPLNHRGGEIVRPKASSMNRWKRRLVVYLSAGLFVGFSAVIMYGCYSILCRPGDRKCVKLC
ncbi:hypothetical protein CDL12_28816 [Handroanthus impetiginosus]|uniref:Uncharacterized protein n=1 Tax=Handroanthus impetiginosus TaxID=429701 RepID=A0A2G9G069_9LAMI|nr:hypothetical protein CDL12_28816 [Handroanthus impetiginosus]